jgi:Cof subfamily protein (haloacid dehalogenase superfamily)
LPIKLIALDIDGTLLDSQSQLSPENAAAITQIVERGIRVALVTGRRFNSAKLIATQLSHPVELIVSNGALVKSMEGETHYRRLLAAPTARKIIEATAEFRSYTGVIFDRDARQVIFEHIDWEGPFVGPYLRRHKSQVAEVAPLADCLNGEDPVEVMFIGECETLRRIFRLLDQPAEDGATARVDYSLALTEYEDRGISMLDALAPGVSKGEALREWAAGQGIHRDEVMAIGDNWNDREMLEYAGLPIVMGNAVADLKNRGWLETLSNDESGVAHALRRYVL